MTDPNGPGRPPSTGGSEHAKVLSDVLEDQKRRKEARDTAVIPRSDTSLYVQTALVASSVFFFYLLFFSPAWVAPTAAPEISEQRTDASLRWYLFTVSRSVESFRETNGRLPDSIDEIPASKPGTAYDRLTSDVYRLSFSDGEVSVTYESNQDPAVFLGDATEVVLQGIS